MQLASVIEKGWRMPSNPSEVLPPPFNGYNWLPTDEVAPITEPFTALSDAPTIEPSVQEHMDSCNDYHVKYGQCYGLLNNNIIKSSDFYLDSDDEEIIMHYNTLKNDSWIGREGGVDVIESIDWTLPLLGAINFEDTVVFIGRKHKQSSPTRYRKGFRTDLLDTYEPSRKEYRMLGFSSIGDSLTLDNTLLKSIFFPKKYEVDEALDSLLSLDRLGASFSNDYYFTLSASTNGLLLWRGCNIIGVYKKGSGRFKLFNPLFTNDLDKLGVKYEVE